MLFYLIHEKWKRNTIFSTTTTKKHEKNQTEWKQQSSKIIIY